MSKIAIYTDGAARGNPGPAGWGVVFVENGKIILEEGGRSDHATNNIMELTAAIEGLKLAQKFKNKEIEVFADSKYVILGITEWIPSWMQNNWKNAAKKPVMNRELWETLYELHQNVKPKWNYVAGHAGHEYNERADVIATSFADNEPIELKK